MNETRSGARWRLEGVRWLVSPGEPAVEGAIEVDGGTIRAIGAALPSPEAGVARVRRPGMLVLPGFVQAHVHLCQTLMRGLAEELPLDRWLRERIWPLEAAHDAASVRASAQLGIAEALLAGATTLLDMGTVRHTEVIAEVAERAGVRIVLGKALMDQGDGVPPTLRESPGSALADALDLHRRLDGRACGRIRVALAPRFTLSVSAELWREIARVASARRLLVHTHVSETPWENATCRTLHGVTPVRALERWGVLAAPTALVHAVWLDDEERTLLRERQAAVVHCPGSNAKLGSGIADVPALLSDGIPVGLGSDGAACNDALDPLAEMRLAAQLQNLRAGPGRLTAGQVFSMATLHGARAAGLAAETGTLEVGKRADFILFRAEDLAWEEDADIAGRLVYSALGQRPREVYVDGRQLVRDGRLVMEDLSEIRRTAAQERRRLIARAEGG